VLGFSNFPSYCFVVDLSHHILHFLSLCFSNLAHADALLCPTPHVSEFLPMWNVSLQSYTDYRTHPTSQPLPPTLMADTTLLRTYHCPHSSLYKLCSSTAICLFRFLTLEDGTNRLSENDGKKLPLYAVQKPRREQISYILWWEPEVISQFCGHTTDIATVLFCDPLYQHLW
jgi:hypothetical protein